MSCYSFINYDFKEVGIGECVMSLYLSSIFPITRNVTHCAPGESRTPKTLFLRQICIPVPSPEHNGIFEKLSLGLTWFSRLYVKYSQGQAFRRSVYSCLSPYTIVALWRIELHFLAWEASVLPLDDRAMTYKLDFCHHRGQQNLDL